MRTIQEIVIDINKQLGRTNTSSSSLFERFGMGWKSESLISYRMKKDLSKNKERGLVTAIHDGIVTINFVVDAKNGEILLLQTNSKKAKAKKFGFIKGMVCSVTTTKVDVVLFGDDRKIVEGDYVYRTGKLLNIPVGLQLFGKVVNSLGMPLDSRSWLVEFIRATSKSNRKKGAMPTFIQRCLRYRGGSGKIEARAPGILDRQSVREPIQTGIKAIDSLIPIGKGQRELIIGDRQTGKTTIIFDTILNLRRENVIWRSWSRDYSLMHLVNTIWCVYVAIGQKRARLAKLWQEGMRYQINKFTCLVAASSSDAAPLQFLAPYAGTAQGEYIRDILCGDCVIFYDDLTKHATAYRQMSLLLKRPPGREAFPGDIFYIHSRLLERAAKLSDAVGAGSLTAFPVVETQFGDISAYIPTNIISITDGQIFLETELFYRGLRPAINVGLSVSRVGSAAQLNGMKRLAKTLKLDLAQFREVESFARLGVSLDALTERLIVRGNILTQLFNQPIRNPLHSLIQVYLLHAALGGRFDFLKLSSIPVISEALHQYLLSFLAFKIYRERDVETMQALCLEDNLINAILDSFDIYISKLNLN